MLNIISIIKCNNMHNKFSTALNVIWTQDIFLYEICHALYFHSIYVYIYYQWEDSLTFLGYRSTIIIYFKIFLLVLFIVSKARRRHENLSSTFKLRLITLTTPTPTTSPKGNEHVCVACCFSFAIAQNESHPCAQ